MVSAAFMLLTVSTLAVHGKHVATDSLQRGCEGKTFCDQKPADYPQKEIDWLLKSNHKNLTFLHRTKRDTIDVPILEAGSTGGNCEIQRRAIYAFGTLFLSLSGKLRPNSSSNACYMIKPYALDNDGQVPQIIVQSQFFKQEIPEVTCASPDRDCFYSFIRVGSGTKAKCKAKTVSAKLYIYDTKNNEIKPRDAEISIDCVCVVE